MRTTCGLICLAMLAACGSGGGANKPAALDNAAGGTAVSAWDSDQRAMVRVGIAACVERASANPGGTAEAKLRACTCAVSRLTEGMNDEAIQTLWRQGDYSRIEEDAANRCLAEGR